MKSEARKLKPERNPNSEYRKEQFLGRSFGFRVSDFFRNSEFGIRFSSLVGIALLLSRAPLFAQSNSVINVAPQGTLIIQGPNGPLVITGQTTIRFQGGQPVIDPQLAAAMQQTGDSAIAQAEFDPAVIPINGRSTYRVVVTAMVEGVSVPEKLPVPPGLEATFTGRAFSYGGLGGVPQPRTTLNYRVTATNQGVYVMPAYVGSANGRPINIPQARLEVLPPGVGALRNSPRLVAEVSPGEFYIGQAVPVSVVLLDPGDNTVQAVMLPQVAGEAFIAEPGAVRYRRETRTVGGRQVAAHINDLVVIPIKEGQLPLVAQAQGVLTRPAGAGGISLPGYTPLIDSEPVLVTVKHLPKEGELPGFTGAIGRFAMEPPRISTNLVRAGDPLTLTVTVRGEGNLGRLVPPKLAGAKGWQIFPPATDPGVALQIQMRGTTSFTYTLIPMSDRVQATPAIPFCYFDPEKKAYVDLTIPPVAVRVLPAPQPVVAANEPAPRVEEDASQPPAERELVMTGLVESPGHTAASLVPVQQRAWFLLFQLAPAAALAGLWAWDRRRRYLAEHPEVLLKARARRGLRRQLRRARRAAASGDVGGFVNASVDALREISAPAAGANPQALVCADVLQLLPLAEREGREGQLVQTLFTAADAWHFVDRSPDRAALLAKQPELEALLGKWKERL